MSDQEILTKAVDKAIAGGWRKTLFIDENAKWRADSYGIYIDTNDAGTFYENAIQDFIYSHDFAKALWGEEVGTETIANNNNKVSRPIVKWQYRLQEMVIADNPIKYLGENI